METVALHLESGHLVADLPEGRFVLDTGAPSSFGNAPAMTIRGRRHPLRRDYLGMRVDRLAVTVPFPMAGLSNRCVAV